MGEGGQKKGKRHNSKLSKKFKQALHKLGNSMANKHEKLADHISNQENDH